MKTLKILTLGVLGVLLCFKPVSLSGNSPVKKTNPMSFLLLDTAVLSKLTDVMNNNVIIFYNRDRIRQNEAIIKAGK